MHGWLDRKLNESPKAENFKKNANLEQPASSRTRILSESICHSLKFWNLDFNELFVQSTRYKRRVLLRSDSRYKSRSMKGIWKVPPDCLNQSKFLSHRKTSASALDNPLQWLPNKTRHSCGWMETMYSPRSQTYSLVEKGPRLKCS